MRLYFTADSFGQVARCRSLPQVMQFLSEIPATDTMLLKCAAAYGMALVAAQQAQPQTYYSDALKLLNSLLHTKELLDQAAYEHTVIVQVTAHILRSAQQFVDEMTIPCTEWPTTEEIAQTVLDEAYKICNV